MTTPKPELVNPIKPLLPYLGVAVLVAGVIGQWYVMNYKLDQLDKKANNINCLIKEVHEIPRPECSK